MGLIITLLITVWGSNLWVTLNTESITFSETSKIPSNKVGLLLGTSKYVRNGYKNLYYTYRINAAIELYNAGKIKYILISGDNGTKK